MAKGLKATIGSICLRDEVKIVGLGADEKHMPPG
jgi:hypothetical protein